MTGEPLMYGTPLMARYPGRCTECPAAIEPGQTIIRQQAAHHEITYRHQACPLTAAERADAAALAQPRCRTCGTNHPGEC